ncbi:prephenate dehydrogenase (NADP(+)) [Globomyces sp. JEL0801]|nr:prephenate dehydrogenase (NADP(+)) [Globomyces sp. JEL0801]
MDEKKTIELGIVGFGDMGKLYGRAFIKAGWKVNVADVPERYESIKEEFSKDGFHVHKDDEGFGVVRRSDFVMFSVEAALIGKVVGLYGPAMKIGAIACGQTSVKAPEIEAFEKYLPDDVDIITCHSLHGPSVSPKGQSLVVIKHRSSDAQLEKAVRIFNSLESNHVFLSSEEHDKITADTQAVTHLAFLSVTVNMLMIFRWELLGKLMRHSLYYLYANFSGKIHTMLVTCNLYSKLGGIENVKTLMALRIYGNKWHVYAGKCKNLMVGLVLLNPYAYAQVHQYAKSVSELFKLMIQEKEEEFRFRVYKARDFVFGKFERHPILLSDSLLDQFSLGAIPKDKRMPNSHLSLLAIVDCWQQLKIRPYDHLICQTPPFRLLLGIAEYLFRNEEFLEEAIDASIHSREIRADDCEFYTSAKGWVECIELGSMEAYQKRFESTSIFFRDRMPHASKVSSNMVELIANKTNQ